MTRLKTPIAPLVLLVALILLVACQPQGENQLILPTPIQVATDQTAAIAPAATAEPQATDIPATQTPTALATEAIVATLVATKPRPTPAIVLPPPIDTPPDESAAGYSVAYVEPGDTLNVRSGAGANYPVVTELPPNATGLTVDARGQTLVEESVWVWVEGVEVAGWVNSRYLVESVVPVEFCRDPAAAAIVEDLRTAIANRDGAQLAQLVHPERGLRLRQSWWNNEIMVPGQDVAELFTDNTAYDWGTADGSGLPIIGTFSETLLPLLDRDLLPAVESACNEIIHGPTAGMTILPESYEAVPSISLYRAPEPNEPEFDWGTWAVGIEQWGDNYYLSYLVHFAYEI